MRIRRDTVFVSAVLFTIALLGLVPRLFEVAFLSHDKAAFQRLDSALQLYSRTLEHLSLASLSIVLIGLIVIWTGYIKKVRWTWFVMCVIVWGWAFPILVLPEIVYPIHTGAIPTSSFLQVPGIVGEALHGPGFARAFVQLTVVFALMVIALVMPIKSFFWRRERSLPPLQQQ